MTSNGGPSRRREWARLILSFLVAAPIVVVVFRLNGGSWAYALSTVTFLVVIQFAGAAYGLSKAHRRGLSGRDYGRLRRGIWSGRVPDDLAGHEAIEREIKSIRFGGMWMLGLPSVVLSVILILVVAAAIRGDASPWWIVLPATILALVVGISVQAVRGSAEARRRLSALPEVVSVTRPD